MVGGEIPKKLERKKGGIIVDGRKKEVGYALGVKFGHDSICDRRDLRNDNGRKIRSGQISEEKLVYRS